MSADPLPGRPQSDRATWLQLDPDGFLWSYEFKTRFLTARTVALKLPSGDFLIVSPGEANVISFREHFGQEARVRFMLAPNSYHNMGIASWREQFPQAVLVAHKDAQPRLLKKGFGPIEDCAAARTDLPRNAEIIEAPGTRIGETWLVLRTAAGAIWCTCDAFFNFAKVSRRWYLQAYAKIMKSAPGLKMSGLFTNAGVHDKRLFKNFALERLGIDKPNVLVPAHGEILKDSALPERLRALLEERL